MIKVSIIVPVYNCEKYLEQCIKSVLDQSLKEIEIICVDDGSTDHSVQIIEKFQLQDTRIKLFQQENQGAGIARNHGIHKAQGKYITFLDADDYYIDEKALEIMYDLCEEKGVAVCAGLRKNIINTMEETDVSFSDVKKNEILQYKDFQIDYNYQNFIFLKSHLEKYQIYFPNYRRFQDPPFLVKSLYAAKQFVVADTFLYAYRVSDMLPRFSVKKICDLLQGLIDNLLFAVDHDLDILFYQTKYRLEYEYVRIILNYFSSGPICILELLVRANQIICKKINNLDYVIRPLRGLLFYSEEYEKKILQKIYEEDEIVLYGAGWLGKVFFSYLERHQLSEKVKAFVVSDLKDNPTQIKKIPVVLLGKLKEKSPYMFVAVGKNFQEEINIYIRKNNYGNYEILNDEFLLRTYLKSVDMGVER